MNVRELIVELQKLDPELPAWVGVGCSCYGTTEVTEVNVYEAEEVVKRPRHVFID